MIHQAWTGGFQGPASDIEIRARELIGLQRRLEGILAKHTGKDVEQVHDDTDRDNFLTAEEARDYGLIDRVMEHREVDTQRLGAGFAERARADGAGGRARQRDVIMRKSRARRRAWLPPAACLHPKRLRRI